MLRLARNGELILLRGAFSFANPRYASRTKPATHSMLCKSGLKHTARTFIRAVCFICRAMLPRRANLFLQGIPTTRRRLLKRASFVLQSPLF
jgi:hypothetical protein